MKIKQNFWIKNSQMESSILNERKLILKNVGQLEWINNISLVLIKNVYWDMIFSDLKQCYEKQDNN